jgi:hypothetical protein
MLKEVIVVLISFNNAPKLYSPLIIKINLPKKLDQLVQTHPTTVCEARKKTL